MDLEYVLLCTLIFIFYLKFSQKIPYLPRIQNFKKTERKSRVKFSLYGTDTIFSIQKKYIVYF